MAAAGIFRYKAEDSPFERYVDLWIASICVAVAEDRQVEVPTATRTWRFEYGSRLQGQTAWIDLLQLLAIAHFRDPLVVADARKVMEQMVRLATPPLLERK